MEWFKYARVAELADALDLGSCALNGVGVRLPPLAVATGSPEIRHRRRFRAFFVFELLPSAYLTSYQILQPIKSLPAGLDLSGKTTYDILRRATRQYSGCDLDGPLTGCLNGCRRHDHGSVDHDV